jgi:hypothetical protein
MKNVLMLVMATFSFGIATAQAELDLTNKTFQQVDKIPNSTTEIYFTSKNQVIYIITNVINGKTYIDKCPGKATISGTKITVNCSCEDQEIYPDPILESFTYDSKSKTLTSTIYTTTEGTYFVWNMK